MIELRLHRALYAGTAVEKAISAYAAYATFERADDAMHWVVRIEGGAPEREASIAGELGNWALGVTVKERGGAAR